MSIPNIGVDRDLIRQRLADRKEYALFEDWRTEHSPDSWMTFPEWLSAKHSAAVENAQAAWDGDAEVVTIEVTTRLFVTNKEGGFRLSRHTTVKTRQPLAGAKRIAQARAVLVPYRASRFRRVRLSSGLPTPQPIPRTLELVLFARGSSDLPTLIESATPKVDQRLAKRGCSKTRPKETSWYAVLNASFLLDIFESRNSKRLNEQSSRLGMGMARNKSRTAAYGQTSNFAGRPRTMSGLSACRDASRRDVKTTNMGVGNGR